MIPKPLPYSAYLLDLVFCVLRQVSFSSSNQQLTVNSLFFAGCLGTQHLLLFFNPSGCNCLCPLLVLSRESRVLGMNLGRIAGNHKWSILDDVRSSKPNHPRNNSKPNHPYYISAGLKWALGTPPLVDALRMVWQREREGESERESEREGERERERETYLHEN